MCVEKGSLYCIVFPEEEEGHRSPQACQTRRVSPAPRWAEAGTVIPGAPEDAPEDAAAAAAIFLKVGGSKRCPWGWRSFSRTPGRALALRRKGADRASTPDPKGNRGRDMAAVRLSPEKGHSGAQGGGLWNPHVG